MKTQESNRRSFFRKIGGLAAILAIPGGLRAAKRQPEALEGHFVHTVFFWLMDDSEETRDKFLTELRYFIDHVDVINIAHIGHPADTDREVIDSSWSVSLITVFDSKEQHDIYQEHPLHQRFIENASSLWSEVLVYDSVTL